MVRRGSSRLAVVLGAALGATAGVSAEEPPLPELILPPLSVPAPPLESAPAVALPSELDTLPPLEAPIPAPVTPTPGAAAPVVEIPPDRRPVLVVPGLPAPRRAAPTVRANDSGVLRLPTGRPDVADRPSGMQPEGEPPVLRRNPGADPLPDGPPPLVPPVGLSDPLTTDGPPPLVPPASLESTPEGRPRLEAPAPRYAADPAPGILTLEPVRSDSLGPLPESKPKPNAIEAGVVGETTDTPRAPSRRRLFGLLRPATPPPVEAPPAPRDAGAPSRIEARDDETIQVQPRSDPAADAALKRRLEAQIRSAMGSQLRALDVRVVDRTVYVRAAVTRFWQKRSARRTLETLPALAGYRTRIEVLD